MAIIGTERSKGRRHGGINRGYYFRTGRGWTPTGTSFVLTDEFGNKLKDRNAPERVVREAYLRWRLEEDQRTRHEADRVESANQTPLMEVCRAYLDHCKAHDSPNTYTVRHSILFDFCTGFPAAHRNRTAEEIATAEKQAQRQEDPANSRGVWRDSALQLQQGRCVEVARHSP